MPEHDPKRPDLDLLLAYWKPALGLSDWVIVASYDRACPGLGRTTVWWRDREAKVTIVEPSMRTNDWPRTTPS